MRSTVSEPRSGGNEMGRGPLRAASYRQRCTSCTVEAQLGYQLGYGSEPTPGIAHRIGIPASAKEVNSISRPRR